MASSGYTDVITNGMVPSNTRINGSSLVQLIAPLTLERGVHLIVDGSLVRLKFVLIILFLFCYFFLF